MIGFMFSVLIFVLIAGLLWYLIRWAITSLGLPQPVLVIVTILFVILFLYMMWAYFPGGVVLPRPIR